jgi:hypothetical protein
LRTWQVENLASPIDGGEMRPIVGGVFPLPQAREAYEYKPRNGKVALLVRANVASNRRPTQLGFCHRPVCESLCTIQRAGKVCYLAEKAKSVMLRRVKPNSLPHGGGCWRMTLSRSLHPYMRGHVPDEAYEVTRLRNSNSRTRNWSISRGQLSPLTVGVGWPSRFRSVAGEYRPAAHKT